MENPEGNTVAVSRGRRSIGLLIAALALATSVVVVGSAPPADAATCGNQTLIKKHPHGVASTTLRVLRYCEGALYIDMTLKDTRCDARSAVAEIRRTNNVYIREYVNSNGCGRSRRWQHAAQWPHSFKVCLYARNSTGSSSTSCSTVSV